MTDQWIPPSKRNPRTVDLAGLGIPAGRYALPLASDFLHEPGGTQEGCERIEQHLTNKLPLTQLQQAEVDFLRRHFLAQVEEHKRSAIAFFADHTPLRYRKATPNDTATAWAQAVTSNPTETPSLLIVGPTGTGKTHRAYATLRAVADTASPLRWRAFTAADLYAALRPRAGRDSEADFEAISEAALLLVDDLGAAKLTEWTEEVTYRLINHRYEQCLPSIFTSNVPPAQLRDALGERITSRLTEMCERIVLKGDDRRKGLAA